MRAVRFHGREDIRLDEVEEPFCGSGQVKVSLMIESRLSTSYYLTLKLQITKDNPHHSALQRQWIENLLKIFRPVVNPLQ